MKKLLLVLFLTSVAFGDVPDMRDWDTLSIVTRQYPYIQMASVSTNDTELTASTKSWNFIDPGTNTTWTTINPAWSFVEAAFYCYGDGSAAGDPDGGTFSFRLFGARRYGGAKLIYQGSATCGAVRLSCNPVNGTTTGFNGGSPDSSYKWVDTIATGGSGDVWMSSVTVSGGGGTNIGGNIATMSLDLNGYWIVWPEITNISSVTSVICLVPVTKMKKLIIIASAILIILMWYDMATDGLASIKSVAMKGN